LLPHPVNLHTIKKNNWQVQSDFGEKINSKKAKGIFCYVINSRLSIPK
jgi:hypothetical protein